MNWAAFAAAAPELAEVGAGLFERYGLCLVGTIRADGWPRVSPCEVYIVDGELLLGMMWRSRKALDLKREPRLVVVSPQCDTQASGGDFKAYGCAIDVADEGLRGRHADAVHARIEWRPQDPYHLFAVDVLSAGYVSFGEDRKVLRWSAERGLERIRHPDD